MEVEAKGGEVRIKGKIESYDKAECEAIKGTFSDHAYKLATSSTKSMTGHLLGAAGGIEAVFSVLALRDQVAPPTINLENQDPECDLDFVPNTAREMKGPDGSGSWTPLMARKALSQVALFLVL